MSTKLDRLTELAKEEPKRQFYSIAHLITPEALYAAFRSLRKEASAGVDGVTYQQYQKDAERKIPELYQRLKAGKYQAQPLRRVYIPKENGKQRPISIPALEDKIVQKVMVEVLNAIYEQDFLDCSYGFRPRRGQHQALDEVKRVICTRSTGWILELDITAYFDSIVRGQLMEMIEKRISDGSILQLIRKWIQVGVIDEGRLLVSETGTRQGQTISPLLAQLHRFLDRNLGHPREDADAAARTAASPFMGLSPCASRNTFSNKVYTGENRLFATRRPPGCRSGTKQKSFGDNCSRPQRSWRHAFATPVFTGPDRRT